jgi:hypothetical protein
MGETKFKLKWVAVLFWSSLQWNRVSLMIARRFLGFGDSSHMKWSPKQQAKESRLRKKPDGKHNLHGRGTNDRGSYGGGAQGKGPSK